MPDSAATQVEDARIAAARSLLPLARAVLDAAKRQADAIDRTERRFGSPPIMHLARLLDDFYMAADNLICDLEGD
jgi:DNA-binding transcriptional LysR family regulator